MTNELSTQVARGFRWSMVDTALQQVVRFAVTVVLTRLVAPDQFGLLAMALVFVQLASLIGDLGLGPALVQRKTIERRHIVTASTVTFLFGCAMAALLLLLAAPISSFYDEPRLVQLLQALSVTYLFRGIAGVPRDLLRRAMRFDLYVISSAVSIGVSGAVALVLALTGSGVWALVWQVLLESALGAVMAIILSVSIRVWKPGIGIDRKSFRELAGFGAFVSATRFAGYGVSNIDNLIVGKVLGAPALGLYNLAYRLMLFPILKVADVVANVTMPALSTLQDDLGRMAAAHRRAIDAVGLICFPVSVGIAICAPALVPAIFGSAWLGAVTVVQILSINGLRLAFGRLNGAVFQAAAKPNWDFAIVGVTFVVYVAAFLIGVQWGIVGVAWAFTIAGHSLMPLDFWLIKKALGTSLRQLLFGLRPIAFATLVMAVFAAVAMALTSSWGSAWARTGVAVIVSIAAYGAALQLSAPKLIRSSLSQVSAR